MGWALENHAPQIFKKYKATIGFLAAVIVSGVLASGCAGLVSSSNKTDSPPPDVSVSGAALSNVTSTSVTVSWQTNIAATSQVAYGATVSYGSVTTLNGSLSTTHQQAITGLKASTAYHVQVMSTANGKEASSGDMTFTTSAGGTPPTVSISAPAGGATVSGTVTVSATATSTVGMASVQFQLDGVNVGAADTTAPYSLSWNTSTLANGNHTLTAIAKDTAGNTTTSAGVTVDVNNVVAKPTVSISAPAGGATVSGTVTVGATASSSIGIASVQFQVDGANSGAADTTAPYSLSWNTSTLANGNHVLTAVAKDTAGNSTTSAGVTVNVNNVVAKPTVSITSPASGATVSGTITVSATASSSIGIASVQFQVDGANVGAADTTAPYNFSWNSATVANGSHVLTAVAKDTAGSTTTSTGVTVTVNSAASKPTVSITAPGAGATVSATVTVSATASSTVGIANVQFQVDGANVGAAVTVAPYNFSWNTTTVANGNHTLTAVAKDTAGNTTTSAGVTVNVNNVVAKPTVSITAPAAGATVSATVTVSATATSSIGIASVQFQVDGVNSGAADTTSPYSLSWNTTTVANGNHVMTAVAKDTAGSTTTSAAVTVNVSNTASKPTVSITAPVAGATVSGSVTVSATASSGVGIASVQFALDGANLGAAVASAPYNTTWDTTTTSNGNHNLTALAKDTAGNSTLSTAVSVTVANNSGTVVTVKPSGDWCGTINSVAPGTTVVMAAGNYTTACSISSSGTASLPLVVRAASSGAADAAILTYQGNSSNVLDIYGAYLQIQWLTFSGMQSGVDAIRLHTGAHDFIAKQNTFQNLGGTAVVYNDPGTTDKISVIGNTVRNSSYTPFYLGCQDGAECHATNVLVDSNLVDTVNPTDGSVGYAVEVKLNSYGTVQNNTFYRTLGPCITVYGSNRGDPATLVQGNYVQGSMTDAGINISGGPAIVWNNVAVGNNHGGIWAQDYGGRGLQKNVWIAFNTVIGNGSAGIVTENWAAGNGNVIAYNAVGTDSGTPSLQPSVPVGTITGNVTCTPATACFDQPTTAPYDLWSVVGGPLIGAGGSGTEAWRPTYDFMGAPRGTTADVGAFQRTGAGSGPAVGGGTARPPFN